MKALVGGLIAVLGLGFVALYLEWFDVGSDSSPGPQGTAVASSTTLAAPVPPKMVSQAESGWLADLQKTIDERPMPDIPDWEWDGFDVSIDPGDSIQEAVKSLPEGSHILIRAGEHIGQKVRPKTGMIFVGEPGAVLDGEGLVDYAFVTWESDAVANVVISGLEIRNYAQPPAHGAIHAQQGISWVVEQCEIHDTSGAAVYVGEGSVVRDCHLHHNDRIGLKAQGVDVLIEGNEIAFNNPNDANDPTFEAGGIKFGESDGVVIRRNHIHNNHGPGIWGDVDAIHSLYEDNVIEDNTHFGINHEISFEAVIRGNTIRNNGFGDDRTGLRGAGIMVRGPNVEVVGNVLEDNRNGIALIENDRGSGQLGSYVVSHVYVHDNTIINSGESGAQRFDGPATIFQTSQFARNTYVYEVPEEARWRWNDDVLSWEQWILTGNDLEGSLSS